LCVAPGFQRGLIGASLIKAVFERSAYGCRLYCCWCAQDLEANYFWETLGFVPIAFRGGSGKKKGPGGRPRVHIFWQRRVREGDVGERATPWWFPAKTDQGAMRADRLVLPIPPGLHWSDPMPVLVPSSSDEVSKDTPPKPRCGKPRVKQPEVGSKGGPMKPTVSPRAKAQFGRPGATMPVVEQPKPESIPDPKPARKARPPKERIDPAMVAKARELRDRYLERVNGSPDALLAPAARYDVSRTLAAPDAPRALPNAA